MLRTCLLAGLGAGLLASAVTGAAPELTPAQRGERALLTRAFTAPTISIPSYRSAWKQWEGDLKQAPDKYDEAFRERYGLHPAPYPNHGYPMGLREATGFFNQKAISTDCLLCHGGSILGKSYVGLGNSALDIELLFGDLAKGDGMSGKMPFHFTNVRGTTEAGGFAVFLLGMREPDLRLRIQSVDLDLHDDLCEDAPAWWLLKKKKTMYYNGGSDQRSVRSLMQFMMSPINTPNSIKREEEIFADIRQFILSLQPPPYPFAIDRDLADKGEKVFLNHCARCHGTYGANWTYPNKIVPIKDIGTDPKRYQGISEKFARYYDRSWFGKEEAGWLVDDHAARASVGYQAPPLDGLWATAPYFHNGSAPTVAHVLNSRERPKFFTRSYRTDKDAYDSDNLGWKIEVFNQGADTKRPAHEQRKVYDTTLPGRSNGGHTYGDDLIDEQRRAVIEYLKTL